MEEFNGMGWNPLHEACFRGNVAQVMRLLESAKEARKDLIESKTIDPTRATPLMMAAFGNRLEVIQILLDFGADLSAEINFKPNIRCGIVELSVINGRISMLSFLTDKIASIGKRIKNLMIFDKLDKDTRCSVGRTIRKLCEKYSKVLENQASSLSKEEILTYEMMNNENFGYYLAGFLKRVVENEESIVNCACILESVAQDERIRKSFCQSNAITFFISHMEKQKEKIERMINEFKKPEKNKANKAIKRLKWLDLEEGNEIAVKEKVKEEVRRESRVFIQDRQTYIECAATGYALLLLSKFDDCLEFIHTDNYSCRIVDFLNVIFEWSFLFQTKNVKNLK